MVVTGLMSESPFYVDEIVAIGKLLAKALVTDADLDTVSSAGEHVLLRVHPAWKGLLAQASLSLQGTTVDLKAAYKQLAVNPKSVWTVCTWWPQLKVESRTGGCSCRNLALPGGCVSAKLEQGSQVAALLRSGSRITDVESVL
eukprot:846911-Amphidinium_carterae.2